MSIDLTQFASHITDTLDKAAMQRAASGVFADEGMRAKFIGAKTVLLPQMSLSGLGDYDRDSGYAAGALSVTTQSCTLSMDRGRSFQLDREDNDETGIANLAGQVMGEFVRTQVVPEMDAYVLSKLAAHAVDEEQLITGTVATDAYAMLCEGIAKVQDEVGYDEEIVAFVSSDFWKALQSSTDITHTMSVGDADGVVHTQIHSLNGVAVLPVPADRMKTEFEFLDGSTAGETDGGFTPADDALDVYMIVCPKRAVSLVRKTEQVRTFDPAHNVDADAWKFDYRVYYDAFIHASMDAAIYAAVEAEEDDD